VAKDLAIAREAQDARGSGLEGAVHLGLPLAHDVELVGRLTLLEDVLSGLEGERCAFFLYQGLPFGACVGGNQLR
jgi:hypothetical protein